jgi:heterotetrameric sarcosine oxidase gamma subunit
MAEIPGSKASISINRLALTHIALLQVQGAPGGEAAQIAARILGVSSADFSPVSGPRAFALGPTEWILVDFPPNELRRRATVNLARLIWRVTDVTGAFASLRIQGSDAAVLLLSDIGAPSLPAAAQPGRYAKTRLGQVDILLHCISEDVYEVLVERSLVAHLETWLAAQSTRLGRADGTGA